MAALKPYALSAEHRTQYPKKRADPYILLRKGEIWNRMQKAE